MANDKPPPIENTEPVKRGNPAWVQGGPSPNPGGRPKQLTAIEKMLNDEWRTPEKVREAMEKLRELSLNGFTHEVFHEGAVCGYRTTYNAAFMEQYLNRIAGLVKDPPIDLSDVPEDELRVLREKLRQ